MAFTYKLYGYNGASAGTPADLSGGILFNRADDNTSNTGANCVARPAATGTAYSYLKYLCLYAAGTGAETVENLRISQSSSPAMPSGMRYCWRAQASYTQQTSQTIADVGTGGATPTTPATYTAVTTTPVQYDAGPETVAAGRVGDFCTIVVGVSDGNASSPGTAVETASLTITFDRV